MDRILSLNQLTVGVFSNRTGGGSTRAGCGLRTGCITVGVSGSVVGQSFQSGCDLALGEVGVANIAEVMSIDSGLQLSSGMDRILSLNQLTVGVASGDHPSVLLDLMGAFSIAEVLVANGAEPVCGVTSLGAGCVVCCISSQGVATALALNVVRDNFNSLNAYCAALIHVANTIANEIRSAKGIGLRCTNVHSCLNGHDNRSGIKRTSRDTSGRSKASRGWIIGKCCERIALKHTGNIHK